MEIGFEDASNIEKEEKKIKWEFLGKHSVNMKVYGKMVNHFRCPICRSDVILYRRKGLLKTNCSECSWNNISKINDMLKTREEEVMENFSSMFKDTK